MQELQDLEGFHEARRGAGFLCQLAGADQRRLLGIFSNLPSLQQDLQPGWPVFSQNKELLVYKGPLPKACSCKSAHLLMIGVTADQKFCSSDGLQPGVFFFWRRVFSAVKSNSTPIAVADRERTLTTSAFSSSSSFSLSSASFSWSSLYRAWRSGDLTTSLLREFSRCERVSTCCSSGPQSDLWRFQRSMLLSRCKVSTSQARFFDDDGIYEDIDWWCSWDGVGVSALRRRYYWSVGWYGAWVSRNFDRYIFMLSRSYRRAPDCFAVEGRRWQWLLACCATQPDGVDRRSVAGTPFQTPMVLPIRGFLDDIKALMVGDVYVGRGSRQRGLSCNPFGNPFRVAEFGRDGAIKRFRGKLDADEDLLNTLWTLWRETDLPLCRPDQSCHADVIIEAFQRRFPFSYDRSNLSQHPPSSEVLEYRARLRETLPSDDGSSADEGVPPSGSGWRGTGKPMMIGVEYTTREYCDGLSGRWEPHARKYPNSEAWKAVAAVFMRNAQRIGTTRLLMDLALGRVKECPFEEGEMRSLIRVAAASGHMMKCRDEDRKDVPRDYRLLELLLEVAQDPEVSIGSFAGGVRVGPGVRMPQLPALYRPKRRWRLPAQSDPLDYLEEAIEGDQVWRRNYSTLAELSEQVTNEARC